MATQIAPTPTVKGPTAVKIWKEVHQKPTEAAKRGAEKLREKYSGKFK